jgi:hypothetical protein
MGSMLSGFEHGAKHVNYCQDCVRSTLEFTMGASRLTFFQHSQQADTPTLCIIPLYSLGTGVHRVVVAVVDRSCRLYQSVYS